MCPGPGPVAEGDWTFLAIDTSSPYVHVVPTVAAKTFTYRAAYVNRKHEPGPWSEAATGTVSA